MDIQDFTLQQVLGLLNIHKLYFYKTGDNYIPVDVVCVWCKYKIYIGLPYNRIPENIRAYFLAPQDYRKYVEITEELAIN